MHRPKATHAWLTAYPHTQPAAIPPQSTLDAQSLPTSPPPASATSDLAGAFVPEPQATTTLAKTKMTKSQRAGESRFE